MKKLTLKQLKALIRDEDRAEFQVMLACWYGQQAIKKINRCEPDAKEFEKAVHDLSNTARKTMKKIRKGK